MKILPDEGFTFDDLLIVPQYSEVRSRSVVDTSTQIGPCELKIPVIAANMDTICGVEMAEEMGKLGGLGILHRFAPFEEQLRWVRYLKKNKLYAVPSVGVDDNALDKMKELYAGGATTICIDVAHGNTNAVKHLVDDFYQSQVKLPVLIVGNFGTPPNQRIRTDIVAKIGIGPGSACETRTVAGVGVPQASAIIDAVKNGYCDAYIADGGIKKPADFAKAIGLGANAVMVGGYFAGSSETPPLGKSTYRGMASKDAQIDAKGKVSNGVAEGASFAPKRFGKVKDRVEELVGGLRSAMSYTGAQNLKDFQKKVVFQRVTSNTVKENGAHF